MRGQEHLLKQVFGLTPAHEPAGQAEEPGRMRAVQLFERARNTRSAAFGEGQIRFQETSRRPVIRGSNPADDPVLPA
jgi:hypothetical protein